MPDLKPFEAQSSDHLRLVLESGHIGIWQLDLASGHAQRNLAHDEIFGYSELLDEWTYEQFLSHVVEKDRERVDDLQKNAIARNDEWAFQCEIRTPAGEARWISAAGRPLAGPDGQTTRLIGHVIDITETRQREARLELVTNELNHRVRNMLAVIKSIVRLSASRAKDIPSLVHSLEGRVAALARSHDLLVNDPVDSLTARAIVDAELAAFSDFEDRVSVTSDQERSLDSAAAQGLALVIHELITNALKYGALSNDSGTVAVEITTEPDRIQILWQEQGGPHVAEPSGAGFGTALITSALGAAGTADLQYLPGGARCEISLRAG